MTYTGRVQNGVVVFEGAHKPLEGAVVRVDEVTPSNTAPANGATVGEALDRLAGQAQGLPSDLAEQHDRYRRERRLVKPCFADTFFFLALLNPGDRQHHELARAANRIDRPVVTSQWVLLELADHLCDQRNRHLFAGVIDALQKDARYKIINAEQKVLNEAMFMYMNRPDKEWSLTDCTSFVLMHQHVIEEALTADHHFEQAGFLCLLK